MPSHPFVLEEQSGGVSSRAAATTAPAGALSQKLRHRIETALFGVGFALSLMILAYATYRLIIWTPGGTGLLSNYGRVCIAGVALLSASRWSVFFTLSFAAQLRRRRSAPREPTEWPFVSVLVPCFNESTTIEPALDSLLQLDYPAYEVLVVNDGSTDDTLQKAAPYEGQFGGCTLRVFDKPNGGKWSAHNFAFQHARGELILCIDADSRLDPPAVKSLVGQMNDPRISGVAGQMRVRNRTNLITRLQGLEYVIGNGAIRMGQGLTHTVLVVPGPIGMFRRSALEEVWRRYSRSAMDRPGHVGGPFEGDTFAEDFDLSLAVLCLGGRIVYDPAAVSRTKAPETPFQLLNQRYRWIRGWMQVLKKLCQRVRKTPEILSPRLATWVLATYLPDLFVWPIAYLLALAVLFALLLEGGHLVPLLCWSGATVLMQLSAGAFFVAIHEDNPSLLSVLAMYGPYNGLLLNSAWFISLVDELRGAPMRW